MPIITGGIPLFDVFRLSPDLPDVCHGLLTWVDMVMRVLMMLECSR